MKIAFVTYATQCFKYSYADSNRYIKYAERLKESLNYTDGCDFYLFNDNDKDIPLHSELNYGFKPHSIKKVKDLGYDIVIWADSAIAAIKPYNHFIEYIKDNGYIFFDNIGYSISDYTNDNCLNKMNLSRNEAKEKPMIMACLMGFNFNNKTASDIFDEYYNAAIPEIYNGNWSNHRHDQSAMSIILAKRNIKPLHPHSTFFAYPQNEGHKPESETVCFYNI